MLLHRKRLKISFTSEMEEDTNTGPSDNTGASGLSGGVLDLAPVDEGQNDATSSLLAIIAAQARQIAELMATKESTTVRIAFLELFQRPTHSPFFVS